ncbi:hypothetical protein ACF0H5_008486 [Mactra antiquata]
MAVNPERLQPLGKKNSFLGEVNKAPAAMMPLVESINEGNIQKVKTIVDDLKTKQQEKHLQDALVEDETILHRAVKMQAQKDIISALANTGPELLSHSRNDSELYKGQTALHIAITGQDIEVAEELLKQGKDRGVNERILATCATGSRFQNTVMLGELPLFVAALTLNTAMFDKVLSYGASLEARNTKGETVCHCLIQYAHLYPEKITEIMKMVEHIGKTTSGATSDTKIKPQSSNVSRLSCIWLLPNNDGLNPLKLAARLGQHLIFKHIMELKDVYCYVNSEDGLFDVELYDVTDIDSISEFKLEHIIPWYDDIDTEKAKVDTTEPSHPTRVNRVPTLEMIFDNDPTIVFKIIELSPLRYVINKKWLFYRWFLAVWGLLHISFMIGYTVYSIRRSTPVLSSNGTIFQGYQYALWTDGFLTTYAIISLVVMFVYLMQEIVRIVRGHMPWSWHHVINCYHNGPLRILMVLFAITILIDIIWKSLNIDYGDFFMVISMILGWWFLVFFLRGFKQFSFFTVMIQKVLVGDMFRFSIVISMELVAFSAGMFIAFRGAPRVPGTIPENENVYEYSQLIVAMFKMMFGLTSLDVLFEARYPWFAVSLYVAFVLLTSVLMINSLIAMMSNTCSVVSQNRELQYRVQQLSIILFFESVLPVRVLRMAGVPRVCDWFDDKTGKIVKRNRSFMEVRSLHEVMKNKRRQRLNTDTMLETIFHTITSIDLPKIGLFDDSDAKHEKEAVVIHRQPLENENTIANPATADDVDVDDDDNRRRRRQKKKKKRSRRQDEEDEEEREDIEHNGTVNNVHVHTRGPTGPGHVSEGSALPIVELM